MVNCKLFGIYNNMKKLKISLLTFILMCFVTNMSAQTNNFQFGVKAGLNLSNASVNDASESNARLGFHAGVTVDYTLPMNFMIQSGLLFSVKGSKQEKLNGSDWIPNSPDMTHTFSQLYLEVPLYGAYRLVTASDLSLVFGAGPYFGYGIGGKTKQRFNNSTDNTEYKWDTFGDGVYDSSRDYLKGETLNRFDFGAGVKLALEYRRYTFDVGVTSSIINIANHDNYKDMRYRNLNASFSLGYKF